MLVDVKRDQINFNKLVDVSLNEATSSLLGEVAKSVWYTGFVPNLEGLDKTAIKRAGYVIDRLSRFNCTDVAQKTLLRTLVDHIGEEIPFEEDESFRDEYRDKLSLVWGLKDESLGWQFRQILPIQTRHFKSGFEKVVKIIYMDIASTFINREHMESCTEAQSAFMAYQESYNYTKYREDVTFDPKTIDLITHLCCENEDVFIYPMGETWTRESLIKKGVPAEIIADFAPVQLRMGEASSVNRALAHAAKLRAVDWIMMGDVDYREHLMTVPTFMNNRYIPYEHGAGVTDESIEFVKGRLLLKN
ncbi:hypothetical protein [Vibrio crassostreae]|uniref:hypothetical protein n=1 Tax=Vibrio crassostreae TaxID=246167 RepID=UPI001B310424|nr:hypothetical protein [Vibrio crassostreae]